MIQRVQTLWLLGVSVCMGLMLVYFIWAEVIEDQSRVVTFTAFSIEVVNTQNTPERTDDVLIESRSTWYVAALAILASLTALLSIFRFKNRLTQMKLGALNSLFMVATLATCYFLINQTEEVFPETRGQTQLTFFLPMAGLILNMISNRFIRRDEKLMKSVERIR